MRQGKTQCSATVISVIFIEEDKETGLLYAKARFYDPDTGKFLSEDAWEGDHMIAPSLHRYLYGYQNPTVYVDRDGNRSLSSILDDAEMNADSALGAFGYRFTNLLYRAGTLGFADIHDPAKDAYDEGRISGGQYAAAGGAALLAPVAVIGSGGTAGGLVATTATTGGRIGVTAGIGAAYGGSLDAYTQGTHIATDVQQDYDLGRTAIATASGAVLAPLASESAILGAQAVKAVRGAIANRATSVNQPKLVTESLSKPAPLNPELQKRVDAFSSYRANKGLGREHNVTYEQFKNFRTGNTGDNGAATYSKKYTVPTPKANSGRGFNNPIVAEAAAKGRQKHRELAVKVRAKANKGWRSEKQIVGPDGETFQPDVITPSGRPLEYKPNTPTGRSQGVKQLKKYEDALGKKGRLIYYEP